MEHMHIAKNRTALKILFMISLVAFITQVVGGLFFGSLSVLSDGIHLALDNIGNLFRFCALSLPWMVSLLSKWKSTQAQGKETIKNLAVDRLLEKLNQMDVDKSTIYAKRFNAAMLPVTGAFLCLSGVYRMFYPISIHAEMSTWIAVVGLGCNLLQIAVFQVMEIKTNMKDVFLHILGDTLHSIFALLAMVILWWKGNNYWFVDPCLTIWLGWKMCKWGISLLEEMTPLDTKNLFPDGKVLMIGNVIIALHKNHSHSNGCSHHKESCDVMRKDHHH